MASCLFPVRLLRLPSRHHLLGTEAGFPEIVVTQASFRGNASGLCKSCTYGRALGSVTILRIPITT